MERHAVPHARHGRQGAEEDVRAVRTIAVPAVETVHQQRHSFSRKQSQRRDTPVGLRPRSSLETPQSHQPGTGSNKPSSLP